MTPIINRQTHVYLLIICIALQSADAISQSFAASIYKDEKGMASNRITQIVQSASGEIWTVTQEGVSTFDGLYWSTFPDSLDIPTAVGLIRMEVTDDSTIYMASSNSEGFDISYYKNGQWTSIDPPNALKDVKDAHYKMAKPANGHLNKMILGYRDSLYTYIEEKWESVYFPLDSVNEHYISIVPLGNDSTLVATSQRVFLLTPKGRDELFKSQNILNVSSNQYNNGCYILYTNSLAYYDYEDRSVTFLFKDHPIINYQNGNYSNLFVRDHLIYYSANSPLIQYNPKTESHHPLITEYFQLDHTCMDALIDYEGSIWVATMRGAFSLKNPSIYNYASETLLENEVSAILEAPNGDLLLGSNSGLNVLHNNGKVTKYQLANPMEKFRIMDIIEHDSEIYFSTYSSGVLKYIDGQIVPLTTTKKATQSSDLLSYDGKLYCSNRGELWLLEDGEWNTIYDIGDQTIRKILIDKDHKLLLAENGIYDIETGQKYVGDDLYTDNVYTATVYKGQIIVGSAAGLSTIKEGKIVKSNFTVPGPIYALEMDDQGGLWVGSGSGVWHLYDGKSFNYNKGNGLIGNEVNRNAFVFSKTNQLLVGTDEGLSIIDNPTEELTVPIPAIEITSIEANQKPIEDYKLSYLTNNIRFNFRSHSYYNIEELNYRYRLLGLTDEWENIEFAEQNTALYPNLEPGKYRFEVQARIGNGQWSKVASSPEIVIQAAFFEAVWFRILFVVLIITGLVSFYKYRSKTLNEQKQELELRVLEKTQQLEKRNQELINTIDDLKAAQGQLIQSEKLASMGHLTSGIAHELNNPLNYIRGGAECIIRNLDELSEILHKPKGKKADIKTIMEESKMLAESIFEGATKSTGIVKSLGSFTADSQNFYSFTDLQKEVETSLTLLNNEIGFRIIVNKMFGNIPPIECYPAKINQMLVNILINSIQAIKDRGEITIRYYRKDDQRIAIEISDDGEGVSSDLNEKVFEPFFTTKDSNPGLGLTIAKSIVQEHKGSISFISKPGLGTKVKIYLPVSQTYHPELDELEPPVSK
ncbi:sensor histidine kinase [Marinoscillum pacificum]|uniref:sensor histidine kinase n=1 Tax=Marinoscillum pacificum TaxID=392723 RepID=UPI0021570623|nr:ATP-binding protein [Marinoscillum pacificum]